MRTWTMAEYRAAHPPALGFPPTSEAAARVVAILIWTLIALASVYIALRFAGVIG